MRFLSISQAEIPSVLSLPICTVLISSSSFIPCSGFQCSCFQSSIKISTSVKFLANTFLMQGVQRTIDSAIEELIGKHRDHISGLHSLERVHTFMALPCIAYVANIAYVLVKPLYHILPIHDLLVCIVHTQKLCEVQLPNWNFANTLVLFKPEIKYEVSDASDNIN